METAEATGLLLVMMDVEPAHEEEFNRWFDEEHFPERMGCPGFLGGRRFRALEGEPRYLAFYELASGDVLQSEAYQAMAAPSPWTQRVMPRITRIVRNVYEDITPHTQSGATASADARLVEFAAHEQEPEAPGIASHAVDVNGVRWAVVEYQPGVLREEWCEEGHSGYALDGEVTYEFSDRRDPLRVRAGEGFSLPDGSAHRGRAGDRGARLFMIDRAG
jgi:hypothetical protein